ncbi:hypothetical protein [Kitasatospora sp. HPMI-4]|uniref:hypothetical protein n=1 Tax=Kitasatospora sp. HPMI-4 TaxID=3448443 RepID=UPI003F1A3814
MSRRRAAAVVTALGAFLLAGAGAAQAGNGSGAERHWGGSMVSDLRGGKNSSGGASRQTATGSGDGSLDRRVYYPFVLY